MLINNKLSCILLNKHFFCAHPLAVSILVKRKQNVHKKATKCIIYRKKPAHHSSRTLLRGVVTLLKVEVIHLALKRDFKLIKVRRQF
jgi:hypothetical protein